MIGQKNVLESSRPSASSTVHKVKKKKHSSLKQIFILSRDALMERKGRSALTILMVLVGGALMVTINGMSEESNSAYHAYKKGTLIQGMWVGCIILLHVAPLMAQ